VIDLGAQLWVRARHLLVTQLRGLRSNVVLPRDLFLCRSRTCFNAATAAVVANVIHGDVIHDRGVVNIVYIRDVDI